MKKRNFNCLECGFLANGPATLGVHYREFPDHRPGSEKGPPTNAREGSRKAYAAEIVRAIALQADEGGADFAAGLAALLREPNNERLDMYLRYIFNPVFKKLIPDEMSPDEKEIRLKEIEAQLAQAQQDSGGGSGQVQVVFPVMPAPDGSGGLPGLPGKTVATPSGGDILEGEVVQPDYDDDF